MKTFNTSAKLLVGAVLVASGGMASALNIVLNPSFEDGQFDDKDVNSIAQVTQVGGGCGVDCSNTKIAFWTVSQTRPLIWIDNSYVGPLKTPYDKKFLDLTAYTNATTQYATIGQNLGTTVNQPYTLTFSLGSSNVFGTLPVIVASAAGIDVNFGVTTPPVAINNWTSFSFNFTPLTNSTALSFTGLLGSDYIGLDNISVTAVPEPGTLAMLFAGLAAVGTVVARKRKQIG